MVIGLVERDWQTRACLKAQLEEEGHNVSGLQTPRQALALVRRRILRPDLLILDLAGQPSDELPHFLDLAVLAPAAGVIVLKAPTLAGLPEVEARAERVLVRPFTVGDVAQAVAEVAAGPVSEG